LNEAPFHARQDLVLTVRDRRYVVAPENGFSFGRSESCDLCLDTMDRGISRIAGAFTFEHGTWWVINRSENRALYIIDAVGLSAPLPVATRGQRPPRRAVEPQGTSVLITGAVWTHEIRCATGETSLHFDPVSVVHSTASETQTPAITEARKEVLVALVSGYLRPFPRHDPRPLTYAEIAQMVGLPRSTVTKRIEAVRAQLREHGVPGLDDDDARRPLAEWLLAMRLIVPADLEWLEARSRSGHPPPESAES
jgi:Winged helix-turn-helix DNA-binding